MSLSHRVSIAFLLAALGHSVALAQPLRLTTGDSGFGSPSVDLSGKLLLYTSGDDLYLHDLKADSSSVIATDVDDAWITGKKFVAFTSSANPVGTNADGNTEVFIYAIKTDTTTQLTTTTDADCSNVTIDKKGRFVAFLSDADITGSNGDNSEEIFLYNAKTDAFLQVTNTSDSFGVDNAILTSTGKYVYFDSDADLTGDNADGNSEIFRYVVKTATFEQLTDTTDGDSSEPFPSGNGKGVAFVSTSTQLSGPNADDNDEVYYYEPKKDFLLRITNSSVESSNPRLSGNGRRLLFSSTMDPFGTNADNSEELFFVARAGNNVTTGQLTTGAGGTASRLAVMNRSGKLQFFESDADLDGQGGGFDHIFRVTP